MKIDALSLKTRIFISVFMGFSLIIGGNLRNFSPLPNQKIYWEASKIISDDYVEPDIVFYSSIQEVELPHIQGMSDKALASLKKLVFNSQGRKPDMKLITLVNKHIPPGSTLQFGHEQLLQNGFYLLKTHPDNKQLMYQRCAAYVPFRFYALPFASVPALLIEMQVNKNNIIEAIRLQLGTSAFTC